MVPYGHDNTALFAVYDGHGKIGHYVSQYVCQQIETNLKHHPHFHDNVNLALEQTFLDVNQALKKASFEVSLFYTNSQISTINSIEVSFI